MSTSLQSGAWRLQRFKCLKYYNAQRWESPFQYTIIFETSIFGAPGSTPGRDRRVQPLTFCMKFKVRRLLFETFLDIIHIFDSAEP